MGALKVNARGNAYMIEVTDPNGAVAYISTYQRSKGTFTISVKERAKIYKLKADADKAYKEIKKLAATKYSGKIAGIQLIRINV